MTEPAIDSIAPISRRAVAYLIDALIAGGVAIVAAVIVGVIAGTSGSFEAMLIVLSIGYGALLLVLLGWLLVYTAMQAKSGSIGMRAQGVRLASADDGMPVGFGRALLRNVVFGVSGWIIVGYFTPLFDSSGRFQGWHDRVAKAVVLDARKSPLPVAVPDFGPAPATTAVPIPQGMPGMPGIPGIPAPGGVQGGFATPSTGAFANANAPVDGVA
ncbi:RDD family protein, partial [Microbacterium sp. ZW T6_19]|uniref:RDD family protein n=1 Tax=Microbacterium sp. ZW T6_19 TaxID=3378082 RepID=UPI003851F034